MTTTVKLKLTRISHTEQGTFGMLQGGSLFMYTLEDPWLDNAPNESCIPLGAYNVTRHESQRHPDSWLVLDVPERFAIMIHPGNTTKDTQGCILPGGSLGIVEDRWAVMDSVDAMASLNDYCKDVNDFMLYIVEGDPYDRDVK